jgi:hypothetical protein
MAEDCHGGDDGSDGCVTAGMRLEIPKYLARRLGR